MFASSKKVSMVTVFQSLYDLDNPGKKFYKAILLNANLDFVKVCIGNILKNKAPGTLSNEKLKRIFKTESA